MKIRKMSWMSEMLPFQVLVVPITRGTAWDRHEKGRCKIRMVKQYLSNRRSSLYTFLYSLPGILFKDLLTSVHFDSNFSVHTIAGIFGAVTGEYYDRDLRTCHIRRKSKISVNLAKQSPGDWLYTHQAGKYLGE